MAEFARSCLGLFLSSVPALAGDVIVVSQAGGGDYTAIQLAVDAAADGDTILVHTGTYLGVTIVDKELAIVADTDQVVQLEGGVLVRELSAGRTVVLAGFAVEPSAGTALEVRDCAGSVRAESCHLTGASIPACPATGPLDGWDGVHASHAADVSLATCVLNGGRSGVKGGSGQGVGGAGLRASDSVVSVYDTIARGGELGTPCCDAPDAGPGGLISASDLLLSGVVFAGGLGGAPSCDQGIGGDGGIGLDLSLGTHAWFLGGWLLGGPSALWSSPVLGADGSVPWGIPGAPIEVHSGSSVADYGVPARQMIAPDVVREQTVTTLVFNGLSGDHVLLLVSLHPARQSVPAWKGFCSIDLDQPYTVKTVGGIGSSSSRTAPFHVSALPAGTPSRVLYLQPLFSNGHGEQVLGTPQSLVVLDQAY